jgi:TolB-like protein
MSLYSQFKRRNVHRMAALYMAAAWLIMQVVDVVEGKLPLPDWMGSAVLVVLAVGFPIALIISWIYEVTPEGITRDTDEQPVGSATGGTGRRVDFAIIAVLAAALLVFSYDKWWLPPPPAPPERSVAVLPFASMSTDEENSYLAAGITDTILHELAQVPELLVTARTTTELDRLKGLSVSEIGALIGVAVVLEGSVQRQGDKLRITAQLINAEDDSHLWSGNFDRDYSDVFAIQDEIAEAVTSALELVLQGETKRRIDREGTDNLQAFEEYSKAIENLRANVTDSVQLAVQQLQRAIELDPDFARAHAMLGYAYLDGYYSVWSELDDEEISARARDAANTALRIAPGMSTALTLLGHLTEDRDARAELYREAVENGPNDTRALRAYSGQLFYGKHQIPEALALVRKAIRLDPLDDNNYYTLANLQAYQKQIHAALETIGNGKEKNPDSVKLRDFESRLYYLLGDYRSAIVAKYETLEIDPREYWNRYEIGTLYLLAGMPDEAERWLESQAAHAPEGHFTHRLNPLLLDMYYQRNDEEVFTTLKALVSEEPRPGIPLGYAISLFTDYGSRLGKLDEVLETFEELYPHLFAGTSANLDTDALRVFTKIRIGLALLQNGDVQRGEPLMRRSLEEADKRENIFFLAISSVNGRLALGETDAALERFRKFDATDKWINSDLGAQLMFRYNSLYDPIREEPEFIELLDMYDKNAAKQRKLLTEMAHELPVK